jgi:hypothetical protein
MKKNGRTAAGAQRWKCPECRVGATAPNRRQAMLRQLGSFVARLLGGHTLREEGRSFRRGTAWCWQVDPVIPLPEAKSHVLETDGTYVNGRCLLVLMDGSTGLVVRIRWCAHESIAQYRALFHGVPAPDVLVSDGMRGMSAAARAEWPAARLQRCLVHVHRDTNRDLTHRPRSQAARELRKLSSRLFRVRTVQDAAKWGEALNAWHQRWKATANEKTTARDDPAHAAGRKWWWTHKRLRRCYKRLEKLFRDGSLFAYTDPALLAGGPVPRDTDRLEGGINSPIKRVLDDHRGMPKAHMMRACEWKCYTRSPAPDLAALLDPFLDGARRKAEKAGKETAAEQARTGDEPGIGHGIDWNEFHTSTRYPDSAD